MSWFHFRGRNAPAAGGVPQTANAPEIHRSLGLAALLAATSRSDKLQVLDLGSAVGSNVEFLSRFGCKLYIEDLYAALATRGAMLERDRTPGPGLFPGLLPLPEDACFDVVLAWDIFNYLERKELGQLILYLARFCRPGARLLAFMSTLKQIPAQPIRFKIVDPEHLIYERQTTVERPGPRYAPAELNELLRGFHIDRSFLLRHGVQEYLFARNESQEPPAPNRPAG